MNELQGETGKRLSQTGSAKILPQLSQDVPSGQKALPHLPQLLFNGNDDWVLASRKVITARDILHGDYVTFSDEDDLNSCPPPVLPGPSHVRTSRAPTLPRKSSGRRPENSEHPEMRKGRENSRQQPEIRKLTKTTQQTVGSPVHLKCAGATSSNDVKLAVNRQIDNMLAASRALKPSDGSPLSDSSVMSKKSRNNSNGMLAKMKNAFNERLHDNSIKKHSPLIKSEQLLDSNLSKWSDYEDEPSAVSAMELRLNEGKQWQQMPQLINARFFGAITKKLFSQEAILTTRKYKALWAMVPFDVNPSLMMASLSRVGSPETLFPRTMNFQI